MKKHQRTTQCFAKLGNTASPEKAVSPIPSGETLPAMSNTDLTALLAKSLQESDLDFSALSNSILNNSGQKIESLQ